MDTASLKTPLGRITVTSSAKGVKTLVFTDDCGEETDEKSQMGEPVMMLEQYFNGNLHQFALALDLTGSEFQKKVWNILMSIPYGKTITYLDLAKMLGNPASVRAVANAGARNPIPVIIPCHRVVGSDGSLTGYAGGLWRKKWLLDHEQGTFQLKIF
jgi:methylated-DNA-[protein]-cysteine S-methyltransferase